MICWPTLITSTTPISTARELVLMMRVYTLMVGGVMRLRAWGSST